MTLDRASTGAVGVQGATDSDRSGPSGPIFVAGADRSGTSLLSALLGSHSRIAVVMVGTNMWTFFAGQYGDLADEHNLARCIAALLAYKNVAVLRPDVDRLRHEFRDGPPTYARLFRLILDQYAERHARARWVDKTSYVERYAAEILEAYEDAAVIHVVRDPRDRYASAIKRWPGGHGQLGGATGRWLYSVGLAERNLRRFPTRYMVMRYEDLVAKPEETLRAVCSFIDEAYEPGMLDLSGAIGFRDKGGNSSFTETRTAGVTQAAVGRFRTALPALDVLFIERLAGAKMVTHGYEPASPRLSPGQAVDFYVRVLPVNVVRLAGWLGLEAVQQRLPRFFGRRPMPGRLVPTERATDHD